VLVLYVATGALGSEFPSALKVFLDGILVESATSVLELFDVTQQAPLYATTTTAEGYEVIIYFPHLSTHTVVLQVPAPSPALVPANYIPFVFLLVAVIAALINIALARKRRTSPERTARPKAERKKKEPWF
jgi:hypothetical protein